MKQALKPIYVAILVLAINFSFAGAPGMFNYQAVFRDANGNAVISQMLYIEVRICTDQYGQTPIYTELFTAGTDSFGVVNLQIGSSNPSVPLDSLNWGSTTYYIDIRTSPSSTGTYTSIRNILPELVSVPYALYANNSGNSAHAAIADSVLHAPQTTYTAGSGIVINHDSIINSSPNQTITLTAGSRISITGTYPNFIITSTDSTPPGTIVAYGGTAAPAGWLLCDGGGYSTGDKASLFAAISYNFGGSGGTFNVPDFRGKFLRGVDGGVANDPDLATRTVNGLGQTDAPGSLQGDALQNHTHFHDPADNTTQNFYYQPINGNVANIYVPGNGSGVAVNNYAETGDIYNGVSATGHPAGRISSETRPKNVYVNYIIKY